MAATTQGGGNKSWMFWAGWVLAVVPSGLLIFSGVMKLTRSPEVLKGFADVGWPERLAVPLGVTELLCTLIFLIPKTSVLGAILLTGYMGGAIATHVRLGEPFVVQALVGVVVWLSIFLREARLRAILPLRS